MLKLKSRHFKVFVYVAATVTFSVFLLRHLVKKPLQKDDLEVPCESNLLQNDISKLYQMYDDVRVLLMVIGYSSRRGKDMAALLDANTKIAIPQQYNITGNWKMYQYKKLREYGHQKHMLFYFLQYLATFQAVFHNIADKPEQFWMWKSTERNIDYELVPGWGQGKFTGNVEVVGEVISNTKVQSFIIDDIIKSLDIPVKFLHIIESPYDAIASNVKRCLDNGQKNISAVFQESLRNFIDVAKGNHEIKQRFSDAVLDISTETLNRQPGQTFSEICSFLGISCSPRYLGIVDDFIKEKLTNQNHFVLTADQKNAIKNEVKKFTFLKTNVENL